MSKKDTERWIAIGQAMERLPRGWTVQRLADSDEPELNDVDMWGVDAPDTAPEGPTADYIECDEDLVEVLNNAIKRAASRIPGDVFPNFKFCCPYMRAHWLIEQKRK